MGKPTGQAAARAARRSSAAQGGDPAGYLAAETAELEKDWRLWLPELFPAHVSRGFGPHHDEYWDWLWAIESDSDPAPFLGIWSRGGGKSTGAELGSAAIGVRDKRPYLVYVRDTQQRADDSVSNVGKLLESEGVRRRYPEHARPSVGIHGRSDGWRRNRLRTEGGFTIDALGLDTAARGVKVEADRPGVIVFDDIDGRHDSQQATEKKIATITDSLLPAGTDNAAVLGIQNLIIPNGVFSRLADGRADFLSGRIVSGPHPALEGLVTELRAWPDGRPRYVIIGGVPTWQGQDLAACQRLLDRIGLTAFLRECQHVVEDAPGGMYDHVEFRRCSWAGIPWAALERVAVWVDPAVTNTDRSDSHGIQADGLASDGTIYRIYSWEGRTSPQDVLKRAILKAVELGADSVGVETDQGGDVWRSAYDEAARELVEEGLVSERDVPAFDSAKAGAGHGSKTHRGGLMLADYERGRFVHVVGTHQTLERALKRFPRTKPLDLADAAYWSWHDLDAGSSEAGTSYSDSAFGSMEGSGFGSFGSGF